MTDDMADKLDELSARVDELARLVRSMRRWIMVRGVAIAAGVVLAVVIGLARWVGIG